MKRDAVPLCNAHARSLLGGFPFNCTLPAGHEGEHGLRRSAREEAPEEEPSDEALSPVESAACAALAEVRHLPLKLQSEAFVLMVKLVVEGGAISFGDPLVDDGAKMRVHRRQLREVERLSQLGRLRQDLVRLAERVEDRIAMNARNAERLGDLESRIASDARRDAYRLVLEQVRAILDASDPDGRVQR